MNKLMIFTDGSVNTLTKVGYGAYLPVSGDKLSYDFLKSQVKIKRFEGTSSTKLELQTLLWALNGIKNPVENIFIYTDSQNIIGLPGRRKRLVQNQFRNRNNQLLKNHELYQAFYRITDILKCEFFKVRGHQKSKDKDEISRLFTLVDRASRKALRDDSGNYDVAE